MSLNYNTELALINTTTNSGTITLPSAITVPGRVISFKDSAGNFNNKSVTLICDGSDTFEDGTTQKVFYESFGSIQVVASDTKWYILSGVRQNSMTISSLITSTISTYSISFSDGSFQTISADKSINSSIIGLGTFGYISSSQLVSTTIGLVDHAELNSSIAGLGTLGYLSSFNSISSLNVSTGNLFANIFTTRSISTNLISSDRLFSGLDITTPAISTTSISSATITVNFITGPVNVNFGKNVIPSGNLDLGASGAFRWNNFWVSTISSIHTQSSTITATNTIRGGTVATDRITGGTQDFNTFTNNLFPTSASAGVGYGPTTAGGGYYKDGYFRSTFTSVIQPDAVAGQLSNVVRVNGILSTNTLTTQFLAGAGPIAGTSIYTNTLLPNGTSGIGNTGNNFYSVGCFTSTFTSVIQPRTDAGTSVANSNVVRINGFVSTQNIFSSTINSGTVTLTTGGFTQRVVSNAVAPSGTVSLNLTSGNVFYFTTAMGTSATANFTTLTATVGSTYYVNFLTGLTPGTVTFTGNTGATTLSITGLSLVGNPSVSIGLHGAGQSFTPAASTRYMFTCIAIAT